MDQFDQPRELGPARKRVRLYVERFLALAREGSQGEDDENAPRIDVVDHVTLDVRDLRVLAEEPDRVEPDAARVAALEAVAEAAGYIQHSPSFNVELHAALVALDAVPVAQTMDYAAPKMNRDGSGHLRYRKGQTPDAAR